MDRRGRAAAAGPAEMWSSMDTGQACRAAVSQDAAADSAVDDGRPSTPGSRASSQTRRQVLRDAPHSLCVMPRIVVDGANVVGSQPDGWWRDRAGAADRLATRLEALANAEPEFDLVLVLEGAARAGRGAGRSGRVDIVHAPGSGDDEIVRRSVGADLVITSDRELRRRIAPIASEGPRWLLRKASQAETGNREESC